MNDLSRRALLTMIGAGTLGAAAVGVTASRPAAALAASTSSAVTPILTRSGSTLLVSGKHRRLSGVNAYWAGLNDNLRDSAGNPSWPDQALITSSFAGMRSIGTSIVRSHSIGISAGTPKSFQTAPGTFVDLHLSSADWAVYEAKKHGVLLMVPMTDQWNYYHGGKGVFVHWAHQQNSSGIQDVPAPDHLFDADGAEKGSKVEDQFFARTAGGLRIRALYKEYISRWLNHVNRYTGVAYKDDPTIAIIETGNEIYSATAEWTEDIAKFIKSIAPHKLVADGSAATGLSVADAPGLKAAHVDIVGAHYYAHTSSWSPAPIMTMAAQLERDVAAAAHAGKAFVLGEYPWTRSDIQTWYKKVEQTSGVAADMSWSFIGGSQVHGGSFGGDDYALHWPYRGAEEQTHAPHLAKHITALAGTKAASAAV